ncbi:type IV toxin-antitoxin system AbiEi family antitoxin domain-containing protein [Mogibacterium sp.]
MIKTHNMIMHELNEYRNPKTKLGRLVKEGVYTPVIRGLYETNPSTAGYLLAGSIYGPSYLSFDFALSYYGMIPEIVHTVTCATYNKKKKRKYETEFGNFIYRDVPVKAYPIGIIIKNEGDYSFQIATKEKALSDKLYSMKPISNQKELETVLVDDLRIDMDEVLKLDENDLREISEAYHSTNVSLLYRLVRRRTIKNEKRD